MSELVLRAPRCTLAITAAVALLATVMGAVIPTRLSDSEDDFLDHHSSSYRGAELLRTNFTEGSFPNVAVIFPVNSRVEKEVLATTQTVAQLLLHPLYSRDGRSVTMIGHFNPGVDPGAAAVRLAERFRGDPGVGVGGTALANRQFSEQIKRDLIKTELVAFPLLLLLGLWVFRGVVAAALPVLVAVVALAVALAAVRLVSMIEPLSVFSLNLASGAAVGLSIDYSLLLVSRFREELACGLQTRDAVRRTIRSAGRTVVLSATTVVAAFVSLLVFPLAVVRSMGIAGMLVAAVAGTTAVVLLPALLAVLGERVNALAPASWQRAADRAARPAQQGAWYRLARAVMRRPFAIALAATAILLALGIPALGVRLTGFDAQALPAATAAHRFEALAKRDLGHGLFDEIVILAHGSKQAAQLLTGRVDSLPGGTAGEVRSSGTGLWMITLEPKSPPFSSAAQQLVRRIRALPGHPLVAGDTAAFLDAAAALRARAPLALALIVTTTMLLIFAATGSVILPFKTLAMNVLSLAAAFGVLVSIFQLGRFQSLLRYQGIGALALTQPLVLGAVTFGILTDYGLFMLTRIKEGWDAGLSNDEAVALGLERTGRIITAAALLFCAAVGALVTAGLVFVKEGGVGVAAAVAVDATIVRALLVPSLMMLLGRWNWWRPRLLDGIASRLGL